MNMYGLLLGKLEARLHCLSQPKCYDYICSSHIRAILDFSSSVWNETYLGDVRLLESVQRRWSRQVADIIHLWSDKKWKETGLFSIYGRLMRADILKCWRTFHEEMDVVLRGIFTVATL